MWRWEKKQFSDNKKMVRGKKKKQFFFFFFLKNEEVILLLTNVKEKCEGGRKNFYLFIFNLAKI